MLFYCWHDAQTRQLRFSLVSSTHGRQPFGCAISPSAELAAVAEHIVKKDWLNADWGKTGPNGPGAKTALSLPVFVANL
ncbi:hypothetical protein [Comamonas thiooxydans]|nr:hypothetical protein [Comamonas thiooxydans]